MGDGEDGIETYALVRIRLGGGLEDCPYAYVVGTVLLGLPGLLQRAGGSPNNGGLAHELPGPGHGDVGLPEMNTVGSGEHRDVHPVVHDEESRILVSIASDELCLLQHGLSVGAFHPELDHVGAALVGEPGCLGLGEPSGKLRIGYHIKVEHGTATVAW